VLEIAHTHKESAVTVLDYVDAPPVPTLPVHHRPLLLLTFYSIGPRLQYYWPNAEYPEIPRLERLDWSPQAGLHNLKSTIEGVGVAPKDAPEDAIKF
jgi:hypothetical protein